MKKDIVVPVVISVIISGIFSLYLLADWRSKINSVNVSGQAAVVNENFTEGYVTGLKDGGYEIRTDQGFDFFARVDNATSYATSFPLTQEEEAQLWTSSGDSNINSNPVLRLKVGDRIQVVSDTKITAGEKFLAKTIKLIR